MKGVIQIYGNTVETNLIHDTNHVMILRVMQTYGNTVEEYELVKMAFHYNALLKLDRLCDSGQGWTIVQSGGDNKSTKG